MANQSARQILANDIKNEILRDLNRTHGRSYQDQQLIESIKREVLMELGQPQHMQQPYQNRDFIEAIKNEVLAEIQKGTPVSPLPPGAPPYLDRATIDSIKKEVIAQIESEQERMQEQEQEQGATPNVDPALVQTIKNSVMAELNAPPL